VADSAIRPGGDAQPGAADAPRPIDGAPPALDAAPTFAIRGATPSELTVGDELVIYGQGFGAPAENVVTFNGSDAVRAFKPGSNDNLLLLDIPALSFLGSETPVLVAISNPRGFATAQITVKRYQQTIPTGELGVAIEHFPAGNLSPGHDAVFGFRIEVRTELDETYDLEPMVPQVADGQPWRAVMVTDLTGATELPTPWQVAIGKPAPGQYAMTAHAFVKVTIPQGTTIGDPFVKLLVSSVRNPIGLSGTSGHVDFEVNAPAPPDQTLIALVSQVSGATAIGGESGDSAILGVPTPVSLQQGLDALNLSLWDLEPGPYTVTLSWNDVAGNNHGWTASLGGSPATPGWPFVQSTRYGPGDSTVDIVLVGAADATDNTLVVTVRSAAHPDTDYVIFNQRVVSVPP
jgi:hypothetical protein